MNDVFVAEGLVKRFGRRVLDDVSLRLAAGTATVLLGTNGAGKSTLLRLALGVLRPDGGTLAVCGVDPWRSPAIVRSRVGYVPDECDAPAWMTAELLWKCTAAMQPSWNAALVEAHAARLRIPRRTPLARMSRGERAKALLVAALGHGPELLLLDEPFAGLDALARQDVLASVLTVTAGGPAILCATHDLDVAARLAERIVVLHDGRLRPFEPAPDAEPTPRTLTEALREEAACAR